MGTHHRESNLGDYGFKTTAHALFTNLASKILSTSCHANLSQPIHLDPVEDYVNSIVVAIDFLPSAITLQELLLASESDPTLKTITECLDTGNWSAAPAPFADLKE